MSFDSLDEIINFAIEKEKEAAAFYEEASREDEYAWARKTFEGFAKEERKHESMLKEFLLGKRKLSEYKFKWVPDMKRSDFLVDLIYEKGMSYRDILRLAMKREEKALKLYNELAEKTDIGSLSKVLKMLAQEEAKHKLTLETLYDDYMAELGE